MLVSVPEVLLQKFLVESLGRIFTSVNFLFDEWNR